jgi:PAS domain S-box-containing protein
MSTQAELQRQNERYELLLSTSPDPMWICDLETLAFLDVNRAAENRYGYSREEFLRLTILDIRPIEDIPKILRLALHPNENRPRIDAFIARHRNKAGDIFEVEVSGEEIVFQGRQARLVIIHDRIPA